MIPVELRQWLLEGSDPSVRYRFLREVEGAAPDNPEVVAAREEIGRSGWASRILELQQPGGQWDTPGSSAGELYQPKYIATNWRLLVLADLGLTRENPGVDKAVRLLMDRYGGPEGDFGGSGSELCFTGNCVRMFTRFGYTEDPATQGSLQWLLRAQKNDGGWHCFESDSGTLDGWEALAAFAALPASSREGPVQRAIERGAEFYLERGLIHEGPNRYPPWERLHHPVHYYYDYLVGLDMLTALGYSDDARLRSALDLLESQRNADGTWNIDAAHPDLLADVPGSQPGETYQVRTPYYPFVLEPPGRPSRWITLTALLVLRRAGRV